MKASVFKTFVQDWEDPCSRHTNVLSRINVCLTEVSEQEVTLLFLLNTFLLNTGIENKAVKLKLFFSLSRKRL